MAAGKVEIGAFRAYPSKESGRRPAETGSKAKGTDLDQAIPLDKIEDFGVHANDYYQLSISYFKSSNDTKLLENMWDKYWANTLSSSTIVSVSQL